MADHSVPKMVLTNLDIARTYLQNAHLAIKELQASAKPEELYKYGINTLELYKVICSNALKSIEKVIGNKKIYTTNPHELIEETIHVE